jgi:hypothetical protein
MANILEYLSWRGDLDFRQSHLNPVDYIIFSQLAYLPLDGIVPGPEENNSISLERAAGIFAKKLKNNSLQSAPIYREDPAFMEALAQAKRFSGCELHSYVNHIDIVQEKQFAALCLSSDALTFIAFRGTDVSFVGWKEDFNMSFSDTIPAQLDAVSYLENAAKKNRGGLYICGHSKGGNLAVYAAASCSPAIRRRIRSVFCNDAPGFHHRLISSEGFREVRDRIHSFVPESSVVGMLFEHGNDYTVVKSTGLGLMQHDLYTWEVRYNDMVRLDSISQRSRFIDKTLREWIDGLDKEHRQQFIEVIFTVLSATQAKAIPELGADWLKASGRMIRSLGNIDNSSRKMIRMILAALFKAAKNNIDTLLEDKKTANKGSYVFPELEIAKNGK